MNHPNSEASSNITLDSMATTAKPPSTSASTQHLPSSLALDDLAYQQQLKAKQQQQQDSSPSNHKSSKRSSGSKNNSNSTNATSSKERKQRKAILAGEYAVFIEELLGVGAFSKVHPAILQTEPDQVGQERFAAKYCLLDDDSQAKNRFNNEANNVVSIHNRWETPYVTNLVKRFIVSSESEGTPKKGILIYERCRGPSLHSLLIRNGPLPLHLLQRFLAQIIEALVCCHARGNEIVHRDIKPDNFLLSSPDLEKANICLIDFGFSIRGVSRDPAGTPMFTAPEIINGNSHGSPADIFALGVTMLCMVFGLQNSEQYGTLLKIPNPPLGAGTISPQFVKDNIDESSPYFPLRNLIQVCLDTDPRKRPSALQLRGIPWIRSANIELAKKKGSSSGNTKRNFHQTSNESNEKMMDSNKSESNNEIAEGMKLTSTSSEGTTNQQQQQLSENVIIKSTTRVSPSTTSINDDDDGDSKEQATNKETDDRNNVSSPNNNNNTTVDNNKNEQIQSNLSGTFIPNIETTVADRVKNDFMQQLDGFGDRIQALLTIANSLHTPARRASVCTKVARLLCEEANRQSRESGYVDPRGGTISSSNLSFTNTSFLSEKNQSAIFMMNNNSTSSAKRRTHLHHQTDHQEAESSSAVSTTSAPLLEQLQWVKSQLASMMNVVPDDEPLPDCDVAIADGVRHLASAALRAMLLGEKECPFGDCGGIIRLCRIVLKKDLAHYSELNALRRKLESFTLMNFSS